MKQAEAKALAVIEAGAAWDAVVVAEAAAKRLRKLYPSDLAEAAAAAWAATGEVAGAALLISRLAAKAAAKALDEPGEPDDDRR